MTEQRDPLALLGVIVDEKYKVVEFAGDGGFSAVYKAMHTVWHEPVAIKFFTLLENAREELREQLLSDFVQEGKLMSQLSSRSAAIVQARDIGKLGRPDGSWLPYMVLEWLSGEPLDLVLRNERRDKAPRRSPQQAVQLLEPAAHALDMAHEMGIAHRDLKPANLFIMSVSGKSGYSVKVLDFGIAKVMSAHTELHDQLHLTTKQTTAFTPSYGAPEQFSRNHGATGPWTDVFAMALILVELLRGAPALAGKSYFELGVESCDDTTRPTPRTVGVEVSDEVEAVFVRALAVKPSDRYARMGEFWDELTSALFPNGVSWRRSTLPRDSSEVGDIVLTGGAARAFDVTDPTVLADNTTVEPIAIPGVSKSRLPLVAGAAVALIASAGLALWLAGAVAAQPGPAQTPAATSAEVSAPPAPSTSVETALSAVQSATLAPEVVASAAATASASASASVSASASAAPLVGFPHPPRPVPGTSTPAPTPNTTGSDPWDPNNFGGRR